MKNYKDIMSFVTFNRSEKPKPSPLPEFISVDSETIQNAELSNGVDVKLYTYRKLPVMQLNLLIKSGGDVDPVQNPGIMNLLFELIDEGTPTRTSLEISERFEYIGAQFNTWLTMDGGGLSLLFLKEHLDTALDIFSDIIINPTFPEKEFTRIRKTNLTGILQEVDQPEVVASNVFSKIVYGGNHPYGNSLRGTEESVNQISVGDISNAYHTYFKPRNASLIVVGDVELPELISRLEKYIGGWEDREAPSVELPALTPSEKTTIYIVDRPGAVQSQIRVGHLGIDRKNPDYFSVLLMNQMLGGQFTSRINLNLRENKGYTYGATSVFECRKFAGHFVTSGAFQREFTDRSVEEIIMEIKRIRDESVTDDELLTAKEGLIRSLPRKFETPAQIAGNLGGIALYDLPDSYYATFADNVRKITKEDVQQCAFKYLNPDGVTIVVVGDAATIEGPLRKLEYGEVTRVNYIGEKISN